MALCSAAALMLFGCSEDASSVEETPVPGELQVSTAEDFDAEYADCIKTYFQAIEEEDYEKYLSTIYPPYTEMATAYYEEKEGSSAEEAFSELCHRFDEDGYESWRMTELSLSFLEEENCDFDAFFQQYLDIGFFDDAFVQKCKEEAKEMKDVVFSLQILYAGDSEPVTVVKDNEIVAIKTEEGCFLLA